MNNNNNRYVSAAKIQKVYDVATATLRRWSDDGTIESVRAPGGKRLYCEQDVQRLFESNTNKPVRTKEKVCYARVSSDKQKEDLDRQIQDLKDIYPDRDVISDIASGINWKRKGFKTLVERVLQGDIDEVAVTHRDRLCRFAFELIESIFKQCGCKVSRIHYFLFAWTLY